MSFVCSVLVGFGYTYTHGHGDVDVEADLREAITTGASGGGWLMLYLGRIFGVDSSVNLALLFVLV